MLVVWIHQTDCVSLHAKCPVDPMKRRRCIGMRPGQEALTLFNLIVV